MNSQDKKVGGIVRHVNTFLDYWKNKELYRENQLILITIASDKETDEIIGKREVINESNYIIYKAKSASVIHKEIVIPSISLNELKDRLRPMINYYSEVLQKEKPDLVVINGTYFRPWCLLQATRENNLSYIVHYHGSAILESLGDVDNIFKMMENDFSEDKNINFIFPSTIAYESSPYYRKIANYKIIPNALGYSFFTDKISLRNDIRKIGFVLRWEKIKNIDFVIDFARYNKDVLKNKYEINIVTDLDKDKQRQLNILGVNFLEPMNQTDLIKFYKNMDIIINPSYFETFGYVAAEALACGTRILISERQGLSEILKRVGLENFITSFDNVQDVIKKIGEIEKLSLEMSNINKIKDIISDEVVCNDMFNLFEEYKESEGR